MPEGDAVWRVARRLNGALAGERLVRSDLRWPSLATADLNHPQPQVAPDIMRYLPGAG